ncbi:MAG: hypothetical protein RL386_2215 [Bacteroidota bacterium]|jgi:hypothetical protein
MLKQFLAAFPKIQLPVTLTPDLIHVFSQNNDPLPLSLAEGFLLPLLGEAADEFTEFIPCFSLPDTEGFHAVVVWKASLMHYSYILITLDNNGALIDRVVLSGTFVDQNTLIQSVATIEEDWDIVVMSGKASDEAVYDATSSKMTTMELLPDGKLIIYHS